MNPKEYGYWIGFRRAKPDQIPDGWELKRLSDVASFSAGGRMGLTMADYVADGTDAYSAEGLNGKTKEAEFCGPAVIVSSIGARCGKCFYVKGSFTTLANVQVIFPDPNQLNAYFLWNLINGERFWDRYATAQPFIRPSDIKKSWVPIPPVSEQTIIARVLSSVDASIDHTRNAITRAHELDHSLLHDLLENGLNPKSGEKRRYPAHWTPRSVDEVAFVGSGVTLGKDVSGFKSVELPYLRVANVQDGHLNLSEIKTVRVRVDEVENYRLEAGDVLMTEGGDLDKLGRGTIWEGQIPNCLHQNHIFRVRANRELLLPEFFAFVVESDIAKRYFNRVAKRTTNLASTNKTQVRAFKFPLPPTIDEQREIVEIVQASKAHLAALVQKEKALLELKKSLMHDLLTGIVRVDPKLFEEEALV